MYLQHSGGKLKGKIEWTILILLILAVPFGIWSNLFAYEYYYIKCQDKPTEVFGRYYRIPDDKGYGIHPGSDYSNCSYSTPPGKIRDPATKAGSISSTSSRPKKPDYDLYVPDGYSISTPSTQPEGKGLETNFVLTTKSNIRFIVRELNKDSEFSYTNLCSRPTDVNWSGSVVGKDSAGREICRVNPSKYIKDYIVGINIGRTGVMLQSPDTNEGLLYKEAAAIFSAMKPKNS